MKKIFTIVSFVLLILSLLSIIYLNLPLELQDKLLLNDDMAWLIAVLSGGVGSGSLAVLEVLKKFETKNDDKINTLIQNYLNDKGELNNLIAKITTFEQTLSHVMQSIDVIKENQEKAANERFKAEFYEKIARELIEGVVENEEEKIPL